METDGGGERKRWLEVIFRALSACCYQAAATITPEACLASVEMIAILQVSQQIMIFLQHRSCRIIYASGYNNNNGNL